MNVSWKITLMKKTHLLKAVMIVSVMSGVAASSGTPPAGGSATQSQAGAPSTGGDSAFEKLVKGIDLNVRVHQVWERQTWQFDEPGGKPDVETRLVVNLVAAQPAHMKILSKSEFIDEAISDNGRVLTITQDVDRLYPIKPIEGHQWLFGFSVEQSGIIHGLRRIHGSMTLKLGDAKDEFLHAKLSPIGKYLDKQVRLPGLDKDMWVKITRSRFHRKSKSRSFWRHAWLRGETMPANRRNIRIVMSERAYRTLKHVEFTTKNGSPLKTSRRRDPNPEKDHDAVTFYVDLPKDGDVLFSFWHDVRVVKFPFTIENVPTPTPRPVKKTGRSDAGKK